MKIFLLIVSSFMLLGFASCVYFSKKVAENQDNMFEDE